MNELTASLDGVAAVVAMLRQRQARIAEIAAAVVAALRSRHKLLTCGNGGSAAEALHLAEELVGRFDRPRRALPACCLSADATVLTCIANDFGYDEVFARQVSALGEPGDVLVALSTSGRSMSVVRGLERAREIGVRTIGLLGASGSPAELHCDLSLTLDEAPAPRVQEAHLIVIHLILECVDAAFPVAASPGGGSGGRTADGRKRPL